MYARSCLPNRFPGRQPLARLARPKRAPMPRRRAKRLHEPHLPDPEIEHVLVGVARKARRSSAEQGAACRSRFRAGALRSCGGRCDNSPACELPNLARQLSRPAATRFRVCESGRPSPCADQRDASMPGTRTAKPVRDWLSGICVPVPSATAPHRSQAPIPVRAATARDRLAFARHRQARPRERLRGPS